MIGQDHFKTASPLTGVAVVLLSKFPAAGKVKTRLTPAISPDQAAAVHRCFLLHMVKRVHRLGPDELIINFDPPEARAAMRDLLDHGASYSLVPQAGGDLGHRIGHIATTAGESHARVLVLAVDSPDVPTDHLIQCAAATADSQVVLGLANDGGYWCIGVRNDVHAGALLHAGIDWSTERAAEHTLANARRLGYSISAGNPWDDVDQPQDLRRVVTRLANSTDDDDRHLLAELRRLLPADFLSPIAVE
jgi:rSAM/selenodomain-associated transferase 1